MNVDIIEKQNQAVLVEWRDAMGPHRSIVPVESLHDQHVDFDVLTNGIPYGVPWDVVFMVTVTPTQIARLLRERGIWTEEDLQRNVTQARQAIEQAYSIDFKHLIDNVRQSREGGAT